MKLGDIDVARIGLGTNRLMRRSPAMLPIPGTLSLEHLKENLAALEIELTDAQFETLR
jgi:pyridoxine 4-dehydrogenase